MFRDSVVTTAGEPRLREACRSKTNVPPNDLTTNRKNNDVFLSAHMDLSIKLLPSVGLFKWIFNYFAENNISVYDNYRFC